MLNVELHQFKVTDKDTRKTSTDVGLDSLLLLSRISVPHFEDDHAWWVLFPSLIFKIAILQMPLTH